MSKAEERDDPTSTWNKIPDDEPIFILRARDVFASLTVDYWTNLLPAYNDQLVAKLREARRCADAMREWRDSRGCKIPD